MSYRLVIVDDQPKEIEGIGSVVNWSKLDVEIVGRMDSAEAALSFARDHPVDIMVTDIIMPDMDGFCMIERLREIRPQIRFIVISCVDQKSFYARAMQLQLDAYLLKPILASEITEAVVKSMRILKAEQEASRLRQTVESLSAFERQKAEDGMLKDLICGRPFCSEFAEHWRAVNWSIPVARHYLAAHIGGGFDGALACSLWTRALILAPKSACVIFASDLDEDGICSAARTALQPVAYRHLVGIGPCVTSPEQLSASYEAACARAGGQLFDNPDPRQAMPSANVQELLRALFDQNDWGDALAAYLSEAMSRDDLILRCAALLNGMRENACMNAVRADADRIAGGALQHILSTSCRQSTLDEMRRVLREMLDLTACGGNVNADAVARMRDYIQRQFTHDIGLIQVSAHVGLSANYAGMLFKTVTGITIRQYIENVRLQHAQERLNRSEDIRASDLAAAVGFNNVSYFLKVFKKHYGLTPATYRRNVILYGAKEKNHET